MKDDKESEALKTAYEMPRVMKLGEAARGTVDCTDGSGNAFNCLTGTNADNCGNGYAGGAE